MTIGYNLYHPVLSLPLRTAKETAKDFGFGPIVAELKASIVSRFGKLERLLDKTLRK